MKPSAYKWVSNSSAEMGSTPGSLPSGVDRYPFFYNSDLNTV